MAGVAACGPLLLPTQRPVQDRDLALARLLQEQENAFMFLNGDSGGAR
jgi:hypothetical protein